MKGDKGGGRGTSNGEKRRREGEQEEGGFGLSSETVNHNRCRGRTEDFILRLESLNNNLFFI